MRGSGWSSRRAGRGLRGRGSPACTSIDPSRPWGIAVRDWGILLVGGGVQGRRGSSTWCQVSGLQRGEVLGGHCWWCEAGAGAQHVVTNMAARSCRVFQVWLRLSWALVARETGDSVVAMCGIFCQRHGSVTMSFSWLGGASAHIYFYIRRCSQPSHCSTLPQKVPWAALHHTKPPMTIPAGQARPKIHRKRKEICKKLNPAANPNPTLPSAAHQNNVQPAA